MQTKKILLYRWKSYNYADIIATFEDMGYQVEQVEREMQNYDVDEALAQQMEEMLRRGNYRFVFSVNYFAQISEVCNNLQIPYVCWSCDSPMISMHHESVFYPCNFIFLFDLAGYTEFKTMGVEHIYHLPLAVNTRRIKELLAFHPQSSYTDEISFVGSLYYKNSYDSLENTMPDYLRGYFEGLMEAQRDLYGINIIERMLTPDIISQLEQYYQLEKSSEGSFSDLALVFSVNTLGFKIAQLQRKNILIALSKKHKVSLYSNYSSEEFVRIQNKGPVDYWTQMPIVFRDSRINLNMTIPNIKTGIPLRAWDVLGAGGFLLTNYQAEFPKYFDLDKDVVCYYSQEDLLAKAEYYLSHEKQRRQIAQSGYERVCGEHTYEKRMQQMLREINKA